MFLCCFLNFLNSSITFVLMMCFKKKETIAWSAHERVLGLFIPMPLIIKYVFIRSSLLVCRCGFRATGLISTSCPSGAFPFQAYLLMGSFTRLPYDFAHVSHTSTDCQEERCLMSNAFWGCVLNQKPNSSVRRLSVCYFSCT